ncbi:MAG: PEGA domain-containing protein [Candidatus Moranbacteria bacterium]|nr:PEGA domain-containing protein [Candidatus Moranbacteria bacterium]
MTLHRLHNVLFWILLAAFTVTTSGVLFFTFGYRFSFERGIFVYTGSIMIKSNPRAVTVSIDGQPVPKSRIDNVNQTIHIPGLNPGEYLVRVEAPGFQSWEKNVTVQSGISTEFWNIVLARNDYQKTAIMEGPIQKAFFSTLERKFAIAETSPGGGIRIVVLDQTKGTSQQVYENDDFVFNEDDQENIEWSPDGTGLLVPLHDRKTDEHTEFVVNLKTGEGTDLRTYSGLQSPHDARWNPTDNRSFFVLSGTSFYLVHTGETDETKRSEVKLENVSSFDLSGKVLFFIGTQSDEIFQAALDGWTFRTEPITGTIPGIRKFVHPKLTVYDRKRVVVYDRGGDGYLLNDDGGFEPALIPLGPGIKGVQFSDDGKKLLFFTENEISVVFTHKWEVQPYRQSGEIIQIARFSTPVSYPQWAKDYEYVLFGLGKELKTAELDHRNRRNITTVTALPDGNISQILPDFERWLTYILTDSANDNSKFSSFTFPEPLGLFGQ